MEVEKSCWGARRCDRHANAQSTRVLQERLYGGRKVLPHSGHRECRAGTAPVGRASTNRRPPGRCNRSMGHGRICIVRTAAKMPKVFKKSLNKMRWWEPHPAGKIATRSFHHTDQGWRELGTDLNAQPLVEREKYATVVAYLRIDRPGTPAESAYGGRKGPAGAVRTSRPTL